MFSTQHASHTFIHIITCSYYRFITKSRRYNKQLRYIFPKLRGIRDVVYLERDSKTLLLQHQGEDLLQQGQHKQTRIPKRHRSEDKCTDGSWGRWN